MAKKKSNSIKRIFTSVGIGGLIFALLYSLCYVIFFVYFIFIGPSALDKLNEGDLQIYGKVFSKDDQYLFLEKYSCNGSDCHMIISKTARFKKSALDEFVHKGDEVTIYVDKEEDSSIYLESPIEPGLKSKTVFTVKQITKGKVLIPAEINLYIADVVSFIISVLVGYKFYKSSEK